MSDQNFETFFKGMFPTIRKTQKLLDQTSNETILVAIEKVLLENYAEMVRYYARTIFELRDFVAKFKREITTDFKGIGLRSLTNERLNTLDDMIEACVEKTFNA